MKFRFLPCLNAAVLTGTALLFQSQSLFARTTSYRDNADNYVAGFFILCGLIIVAQILTAFREPVRPGRSIEEVIAEAEAAHHLHMNDQHHSGEKSK